MKKRVRKKLQKTKPLDMLHRLESVALATRSNAQKALRRAYSPAEIAAANTELREADELVEHVTSKPEYWLEFYAQPGQTIDRDWRYDMAAAGVSRQLCKVSAELHAYFRSHRPPHV